MAPAKKRTRGAPAARARAGIFDGGRWPAHRRRIALAIILAIGAVLLLARVGPHLSPIGDNAEYVVIAESLLLGHGLAHENDPALKPETKYPPVYPALLAPLVAAFPGRVVPLKMFTVACGFIAIWLSFLLIEARAGTAMGALVALLLSMNSNFLNFSQEVLAEIPYLTMTLGALWFLERASRLPASNSPAPPRLLGRDGLFALLLAAAASNTRTVGLGLGIAVVLYGLIARRRAAAAIWFGLFLAANLPWFIRNRLLGTAGTYAEQIMMVNPYRPWLGKIGPSDVFVRIRENLVIYVQQAVPELFFAPTKTLPPQSAAFVFAIGLALTLAVLAGLYDHLRRGRGALEIYVLFFLGTCLLWPQVWSSVRFLVPVLPLMLYYGLDACRVAGGWLNRRSPGFFSPALGRAAILALLLVQVVDTATGLAAPRGLPPEWETYYAAADWMGQETPPTSIVVCRSTYLFYLRAHRKTVGYVFSEKPEEVVQSILDQKATHVVVDHFRWTNTTVRYLIPALQSRQQLFEPVHQTVEPVTWVLAVKPAPGAGPP